MVESVQVYVADKLLVPVAGGTAQCTRGAGGSGEWGGRTTAAAGASAGCMPH
jgi:hypothetical protein